MAGGFPVVVLLLVSSPFAPGIRAQETKTGNTRPTQDPAGKDPAAQRPAQTNPRGKPAQEISTPQKEPNLFLRGWMAELLYGDRAEARKYYSQAAEAKNLPGFQSELALLRLWESSWSTDPPNPYRDALAGRGIFPPPTRWPRRRSRTLNRLYGEFAQALEKDDTEALESLRDQVEEYVERNSSFRDPRRLVISELPGLRGEQPAVVDRELEAWKQQRKVAMEQGDTATAKRLGQTIRRRQVKNARNVSRQLVAKRWTKMTRLHLDGRHRQALEMEKMLGRGRRFRPRRRRIDVSGVEQRVTYFRALLLGQQKADFAKLSGNLKSLIGSRGLLEEERTVLQELQKRIVRLEVEQKWGDALQLAVRTPYRNQLFHTR